MNTTHTAKVSQTKKVTAFEWNWWNRKFCMHNFKNVKFNGRRSSIAYAQNINDLKITSEWIKVKEWIDFSSQKLVHSCASYQYLPTRYSDDLIPFFFSSQSLLKNHFSFHSNSHLFSGQIEEQKNETWKRFKR